MCLILIQTNDLITEQFESVLSFIKIWEASYMYIFKFFFSLGGCAVGEFWDTSNMKCSLCPKHFYQNMTGKDYCLPCPLGKKTSGPGSTNSTQCFGKCPGVNL